MKLSEKIMYWLLMALAIVMCIFIIDNRNREEIEKEQEIINDTIYIERVDTIHLAHEIIKWKPQPLRVDTLWRYDTLTNVAVQHISKTYEVDSSYTDTTRIPSASVGYHLLVKTNNYDVDSIGLNFHLDYPIVYETNEMTKYKKKRWDYGIQCGMGYGIINKRPDVFIGFGIQYNI